MKNILVTGGAGFIGSYLCEKLINIGENVICLDNLYTGSINNIKHLLENSNFSFLEKDITSQVNIKVDEIYNLACPASPLHYQKDPTITSKTNVIGAMNMLELAYKNSAKILQASTSEVYGNPIVHPQSENYFGNVNPIGIRACYDEGKRMAETLFFDYRRKYGLDIRVARIFNTYGPRMSIDDGRVISSFIISALKNEDIVIFGGGLQTRSFCYVDDLIDGIVLLMNSSSKFTTPINIGNPEEYTILELSKKIIDITKSKSEIIHNELPEDDPICRKPVIDLAYNMLGWKPTISLDVGLRKTIDFYRDILNLK